MLHRVVVRYRLLNSRAYIKFKPARVIDGQTDGQTELLYQYRASARHDADAR